jgi:hypothetical protein
MSIAFVGKQRTIDERIILEVIDDLDLKIRTNVPADVSPPTKLNAVPEKSSVQAALHTELKLQPSCPSMRPPSFEERRIPTDAHEWIVEFGLSDFDSLSRPKQQRSERPSAPPPPPVPKADQHAPEAPPSLSSARGSLPRVAAAAAGAMSNNGSDVNGHDGSNVGTTDSTPLPRRVVGGARRHPPRKISNWRTLAPQVFLVVLLFVALGWLATQARRRVEAHLAPKAPVGMRVLPAGAIGPAARVIREKAEESAEFCAPQMDTFGLGAVS